MVGGLISHKLGHRGVVGGVDSGPAQHLADRQRQNAQVEPERLMIDVPNIVPELLLPRQRVAASDLGPARDAGPDRVSAHLLGGVAVEVLDEQRTRPHQAHIAFKHIEHFRQFVQGSGPEPPSEPCQAVDVREQISLRIPRMGHGPELPEIEDAPAEARTGLSEEYGAAEGGPDTESQKEQDREPDRRGQQNKGQIKQPLHWQERQCVSSQCVGASVGKQTAVLGRNRTHARNRNLDPDSIHSDRNQEKR